MNNNANITIDELIVEKQFEIDTKNSIIASIRDSIEAEEASLAVLEVEMAELKAQKAKEGGGGVASAATTIATASATANADSSNISTKADNADKNESSDVKVKELTAKFNALSTGSEETITSSNSSTTTTTDTNVTATATGTAAAIASPSSTLAEKDVAMLKRFGIEINSDGKTKAESILSNIELLKSNDNRKMLTGAVALRRLLCVEDAPPISEVVEAGGVPLMIGFMEKYSKIERDTYGDDSETHEFIESILFELAWCLTNVASGTSEHTKALVDAGGVDIFLYYFQFPKGNSELRTQTAWCLGNVAGDSVHLRDLLLTKGAMKIMIDVMSQYDEFVAPVGRPHDSSLFKNALWTMSNLVRGKPSPSFSLVSESIPFFANVVAEFVVKNAVTSYDADGGLGDALWALSYLSDGENMRIDRIIECKGLPENLLLLVSSPVDSVVTPALRTVGNIVTGDDHQTQCMVDLGVCKVLTKLITSSKKSNIRKEAIWAMSNVAAGNQVQIQVMLETPQAIESVIKVLMDRKESFDLKKEATWVLANAAQGGSLAQHEYLLAAGAVEAIIEGNSSMSDLRTTTVGIEGIECLANSTVIDGDEKNVIWEYMMNNTEVVSHLQQVVDSWEEDDAGQRAQVLLDRMGVVESDDEEYPPAAPNETVALPF